MGARQEEEQAVATALSPGELSAGGRHARRMTEKEGKTVDAHA